jgi:hypothetical protein
MTPIGLGYSMPATMLGSVNTSDAVVHGKPHAHLYACNHIASSLSSSLSVHGTSAAEYLKAPTQMLVKRSIESTEPKQVYGVC